MSKMVKNIVVNVPAELAYRCWRRFEDFPRFMEGVREVARVADGRYRWRVEFWGKDEEWEAEVTEDVPNERIVWRYTSGVPNGGVVTFQPLSHAKTVVTLQLGYDPQTFLERIGDRVGMVERRVDEDLARFKEFAEKQAAEALELAAPGRHA